MKTMHDNAYIASRWNDAGTARQVLGSALDFAVPRAGEPGYASALDFDRAAMSSYPSALDFDRTLHAPSALDFAVNRSMPYRSVFDFDRPHGLAKSLSAFDL